MVGGVANNCVIAFAGAAWLAGALCLPALACDLSPSETGTVAAIIDGETLQLTDGRTVRLIGAKAPLPPLGWRGENPWPLVDEAKEALTRLAGGKAVVLRFGGRHTDRHGHALAQIFVVGDGTRLWLQEEMIAKGLARVYSLPDSRACVPELMAREKEARAARRGVWGSWAYRIESALDVKRLGRLVHSYQIVEGKVVAVGEGRIRMYLNFAQDWRRDFTISVERKEVSAFAAAGIDLKTLAGARVRVRGFLAWRNGPMIEASHPEQIELLPEGPRQEM
jgi:endonuclease YncB( thermonuclease family)